MTDVVYVATLLGIVLAIAMICTVASIASNRGQSYGKWFAAALFFTPPIALLMLIAASDGGKK